MQCKTLHKKIIFFLEGELPEKETNAIKAHLNECDGCKAFAAEIQKTLGIIETEKHQEVNPFFYTRLKAKLENRQQVRHPFWKPVLVKVLQPAFFSILLIIGIYSGIKVVQPADNRVAQNQNDIEMIPFLNEMSSEPIEAFLME